MRAVLIHPPPHGEVPFRHIGLAYLQAVLRKAGIETIFYDISTAESNAGTDFYDDYILHLSKNVGNVGDCIDPRILMEVIHPEMFDAISPVSEKIIAKAEKYLKILLDSGDVFLFSVNIITYYFAAALAYRLRRYGKKTAAGGPNMRFAPLRRLLLKSGVFDAVVQGEGEGIVIPLVNQLTSGKNLLIPGVSVLNGDGGISDTPQANPLPLDQIPLPSFSGMEIKDFVPVLAGRGCTFRCSFCSEPYNWNGYRVREPKKIIDEMEWSAAQYRTKNFHFHDDLMNGNLKWFDAFLASLIDRGLNCRWESFCSPKGLTPDRLDRMKESGCVLIKLGVQSFSPTILAAMRRGKNTEAIKKAIIYGEKIGISMHYDMLTCFPGETWEDHKRNVAFIEEIYAECPNVFFSLNPFYLSIGSETHLWPEKFGIEFRYFDPSELPHPLSDIVRESGEFPVGFEYNLSRETILKRIEELGGILRKHHRDYLYLGQSRVPPREKDSGRDSEIIMSLDSGEPKFSPLLELVKPWEIGAIRKGWLFKGIKPLSAGEDGIAAYLFNSSNDGEISLNIKIAERDAKKSCYCRTRKYNIYYTNISAKRIDMLQIEALLKEFSSLVMRNEARDEKGA